MYNKKLIQSLSTTFGYKFVDSIDIIEHDYNWISLYHRLTRLKKAAWPNNEKILIQHSDTEFFLNGTGLSIYNFNQIIRALDIDPMVFVVLTNHRNSSAEWNSYCDHKKNQFHIVESPLTTLITNKNPVDKLDDQCRYHFGTMLGHTRGHRVLLAKFLLSNNILKHSLVSINLTSAGRSTDQTESQAKNNVGAPTFITTNPNTRVNEQWIYSQQLVDLYNAVPVVPQLSNKEISGYSSTHWLDCPWYKDIFVDLVTETVFNYPYPFISEKIIRPIVLGRPFILFGAPGTIKWLHDLGFRTFDNYWDESYDAVQDPNQRFAQLCKLIETINDLKIDSCQEILKSMQDILIHNQQNYRKWINNELS